MPSPPLRSLTCAAFAPLVGDTFDAERDGVTVPLRLVEARPVMLKAIDGRAMGKSGTVRTDPFTLLFRGPSDLPLEQGIRTFRHPSLADTSINIVPIGPGETGLLYEAIFN